MIVAHKAFASLRFPLRSFLQTLVCCLLLAAPGVFADQQAQLKQLQENIKKLQQELKQVQGARAELQQELQKSESEMGELLKKIDRVKREINEQNQQLDQLNNEREQLQDARRQQQDQVAEQIQAVYKTGQQSQIKLLLNQESPEQLTRMLAYHQWILAAHNEKLSGYLHTLQQLDALEPQILAKREQLEASHQQLARQQQQLKQHQNQRQQTLARMSNTLTNKQQELQHLEEDRQRLQALVEEVERALAQAPLPTSGEAFSKRRGKLLWPTQGRLVARFGSPRAGGQMQWNGVLITGNAGQPVLAVHHGRVVFADYFRGHGLLLIIDHGEGYLSLYAHNQSLFKSTGDWVAAGDAIASVGNSGGQEQVGLYFEIRQGGKPIDPAPWLARV